MNELNLFKDYNLSLGDIHRKKHISEAPVIPLRKTSKKIGIVKLIISIAVILSLITASAVSIIILLRPDKTNDLPAPLPEIPVFQLPVEKQGAEYKVLQPIEFDDDGNTQSSSTPEAPTETSSNGAELQNIGVNAISNAINTPVDSDLPKIPDLKTQAFQNRKNSLSGGQNTSDNDNTPNSDANTLKKESAEKTVIPVNQNEKSTPSAEALKTKSVTISDNMTPDIETVSPSSALKQKTGTQTEPSDTKNKNSKTNPDNISKNINEPSNVNVSLQKKPANGAVDISSIKNKSTVAHTYIAELYNVDMWELKLLQISATKEGLEIKADVSSNPHIWEVYSIDENGSTTVDNKKANLLKSFYSKDEAVRFASEHSINSIIKLTDNDNIRYTVYACCGDLDKVKRYALGSGIDDKVFSIRKTVVEAKHD